MQPTAGSLHYGHTEGLSERSIEKDMTLNKNIPHILMIQSSQQTDS